MKSSNIWLSVEPWYTRERKIWCGRRHGSWKAVFEVGRRVGGRSFPSTNVLHELVLSFVIHQIVSMEDHAHIGGRVRKVRGERSFFARGYAAVLSK
jgi:hypothetical protein